MDTSTVAIAAVITGVVAGFAWPNVVDRPVTATYACNSATFENRTDEMVRVSHGVPRSSAVTDVIVPPGGQATVDTNTTDFRWWASSPDGTKSIVSPGRSVDLTDRCNGPDTDPTPSRWGGLANTGGNAAP